MPLDDELGVLRMGRDIESGYLEPKSSFGMTMGMDGFSCAWIRYRMSLLKTTFFIRYHHN